MYRRMLYGAAAILAVTAGVMAAQADQPAGPEPNTPIKHVIVIFGENQSFDHYFGTYPTAANPPGQPAFIGSTGGHRIDNLVTADLLGQNNPNSKKPRRLDRSEAVTCDFNHNYDAEQRAFNGGLMNKFPENSDGGACPGDPTIVMSYYDGNTVTALWNYAQTFAMSDHHFGTTFGPSTIGAINLISGSTAGVNPAGGASGTMINNSQPLHDDCSTTPTAEFSGRNVGNLLNDKGVTWGWFAGGFKPTSRDGAGKARCQGQHANVAGGLSNDYLPHHAPFQYYASTANPSHLPPTSVGMIGQTDQAKHLYDLTDFDAALTANNLPQVSFLKAMSFEDGHPGYSGPLDEQRFIVRTVNAIMRSPYWDSTAIFLAYDDSDGWYDHAFLPPQQGSNLPQDSLNGVNQCGPPLGVGEFPGRCGPGPRIPLVIVSPWAKQNFIDHTQTEQTSILRFIEDNWDLGRIGNQSFDARAQAITNMFDFDTSHARAPKLLLDQSTGLPLPASTPTATPTASAPAVPTATATVTATPKPPAPTPAKVTVKLRCKVAGGGKRVKLTCTGTGKDAARRTTLRFQIRKGSKVLASAKATLTTKKAKVTVKASKRIKAGKYTLRITLAQAGRTTITTTQTIRLK